MRFLIAVLVGMTSVAECQVTELLPGSRLRVQSTTIQGRLEGTLMAHEGPNLIIATSGAVRTAVPQSGITQVRVSMGKSHIAGAVRGAKIGAIAMGTVASVLAFSFVSVGADASGAIPFVTHMAASGAVWGLAIGGVVGTEKWTTVYRTPVKADATR